MEGVPKARYNAYWDTNSSRSGFAQVETPQEPNYKNETAECNIYRDYVNHSDTFFGLKDVDGYSGIPQNLLINVCGFVLMILVFCVLRKKAWNYGRIALAQRIDDLERRLKEKEHLNPIQISESKRLYRYPSEGHHAVPLTYVDVRNQLSHKDIILEPEVVPATSKTSGKVNRSTNTEPSISSTNTKSNVRRQKKNVPKSSTKTNFEIASKKTDVAISSMKTDVATSAASINVPKSSMKTTVPMSLTNIKVPMSSTTVNVPKSSTNTNLLKSVHNIIEIPSDEPWKEPSSVTIPVDVVYQKSEIAASDDNKDHSEKGSIVPSVTPTAAPPTKVSKSTSTAVRKNSHRYSKIALGNESIVMDSGYFSWIKILFTLTDDQIEAKSGIDCVIYLSFQRHLIVLALLMTLGCLLIILPINIFNGSLPINSSKIPFHQTTMLNISKEMKHIVFAHQMLCAIFFIVGIGIMRIFSTIVKFTKKEKKSRSVIITGISKEFCNENNIINHFREVMPDAEIKEVTLAFDICRLQSTELKRQRAKTARKHWEKQYERSDNTGKPIIKPYVLGAICPHYCCCCCNSVDAIDYYSQMEAILEVEVKEEKDKALTKSLGIAFVTFAASSQAKLAVRIYSLWSWLRRRRPISRLSNQLTTSEWSVGYAPPPTDLYWENLTSHEKWWATKVVFVNLVLLVIVVLFTTPVHLIEFIVKGTICRNSKSNSRFTIGYCFNKEQSPSSAKGLLLNTLPTFLLWIGAAVLPSLVAVSDEICRFWTRSAHNRSRMIKSFSYLVFMVIIFPSLGVTSFKTLIEVQEDDERRKIEGPKWVCVFSEENGSLFAHYLITSTFLGTGSELLRLPELLVYFCKLLFAKSTAEIESIRETVVYEFPIGAQYAWFMLNFAIFCIFCVIMPVITPFGLLYLIFRYMADRYNIYFAYGPTKVTQDVHATAMNFVMTCLYILQVLMLIYVTDVWKDEEEEVEEFEEDSRSSALKYCTYVTFSIITALYVLQLVLNICTTFNPSDLTGDGSVSSSSDLSDEDSGDGLAEGAATEDKSMNAGDVEHGYQASFCTMMPGGTMY